MVELVIETGDVARQVETFVSEEFRQARQYDNREVLDSSGVWKLHDLAAKLYAQGFLAGRAVEGVRVSGERERERDAARAEERAAAESAL